MSPGLEVYNQESEMVETGYSYHTRRRKTKRYYAPAAAGGNDSALEADFRKENKSKAIHPPL